MERQQHDGGGRKADCGSGDSGGWVAALRRTGRPTHLAAVQKKPTGEGRWVCSWSVAIGQYDRGLERRRNYFDEPRRLQRPAASRPPAISASEPGSGVLRVKSKLEFASAWNKKSGPPGT